MNDGSNDTSARSKTSEAVTRAERIDHLRIPGEGEKDSGVNVKTIPG